MDPNNANFWNSLRGVVNNSPNAGILPTSYSNFGMSFGGGGANNGSFWSNLTNFFGDYGGDLLKGLGTLGGIYTGIQQNRLAKDALNQAKEQAAWERMSSIANLQRQAKVYNDALRDRLLNRSVQNTGSTTGWENEYAQRMMDENANI